MKKELILIGAGGVLGKGASGVLVKKDFDQIYLIDRKIHELNFQSSKIKLIECKDLSIEENVIECFRQIPPSKEKVFFLFSTIGGFAGGKKIRETDAAEFEKMNNLNLKSSFFIAKYFSQIVKESAGGSICFTAALTGVQPEIKKSAYGLAKAGLIHLVKTLSLEGREINLTANAIAPYIIDTPENRKWIKETDYDAWLKPEEIGELIFSLFSNYNFVSGNVLKLPFRLRQNVS